MKMSNYFENTMDDFGIAQSKEYLNENLTDLSDGLKKTINLFVNTKLQELLSQEEEIFSSGCVYTGAAGVGLLLYLRAKNSPNGKDGLREALHYAEESCRKGGKGTKEGPSFLCGAAGPLALAAVTSYRLGLPHQPYIAKLEKLLDLAEKFSTPDELLYGRAGYLFALLFVNRETGQDFFSQNIISKVVESILHSGHKLAQSERSACPLLYRWHDSLYLGAAHGTAGILYLLLQAGGDQNELRPALDWLLEQRHSSGNLPSSLGSRSGDRLVQWCHGAPGLAAPLLLAGAVWGEPRYVRAAEQCGELVWQRGLAAKGYSLCHGVAGNAYTLLQLFQATGAPAWLYRAARMAEWCVLQRDGTEQHSPDRPLSLFEGLAGRLYFLTDILDASRAKFPAYTL